MIVESLFHYQLIVDIYCYRYYIFIVFNTTLVFKTNQGDGVRALARLRYENVEEWNKYWLEEREREDIISVIKIEIVLNTI